MTRLFRTPPVAFSLLAGPGSAPTAGRLLCALLIALCGFAFPTQAGERHLVFFDRPDSAEEWLSVNDGVMGGVSDGNFEITEANTLLFTGTLSLENNGGFASVRTEPRPLDLSGVSGIEVRGRGDGRTYWIELRGAGQRGATSYRAPLPTFGGSWTTLIIPVSDFRLQSYGRPVEAPPVDPSSVRSLGFTLADKKAGPFRLEIQSVKSVFQTPDAGSAGEKGTIVDVATSAGRFNTLLAAATAADLAATLAGEGPFTVFAPTDEAFAKLPSGTVETLLKAENKQQLGDILRYHVIPGRVALAQALEAREARSLQGAPVRVAFADGRVGVGPATLVTADIEASNGIIHVIDQVLMPPEVARAPLSPPSLIELAIERGVPLFNHGNPSACASVYEVTCEALRAMPALDERSSQELSKVLTQARGVSLDEERAWILRHALDRVYHRLTGE